jgi:hypothetical protein
MYFAGQWHNGQPFLYPFQKFGIIFISNNQTFTHYVRSIT